MKTREESITLMKECISSEALINHCEMVAQAMEAYAHKLNLSSEEVEMWWTAGLLHDLDWEKYPDEHPNVAVNDILPSHEYPEVILEAIKAHAPTRTGKVAEALIEKYLFACDELSGFLFASKLIRPNGWDGMEVSSIKKKLKDKRFAANVSREDITMGAELIEVPLEDHIQFLITEFSK